MSNLILGVIGKPIFHSKSPQLHSAALKSAGLNGVYLRLAVESANEALELAKEMGIKGLNVTAPFKESMCELIRDQSLEVKKTAAINTVIFNGNEPKGFNTDVIGIKKTVLEANFLKPDSKIVILGAGGAARAVLAALEEYSDITIINRNLERAKKLSSKVKVIEYSDSRLEQVISKANLIINTTSCSDELIAPYLIKSHHYVLDAVYAKETALINAAKAAHATILPGLNWLIYQAEEAFSLFTGKNASAAEMQKSTETKTNYNAAIILIGMMASGKSSVAQELSKLLDLELIELDSEIERASGKKISDIFEQDGEEKFRELEKEALFKVKPGTRAILSCGGGIILNPENILRLKELGIVVWLWSNINELSNRLANDTSRPLIEGSLESRRAKLSEILNNRFQLYATTSDLVINTNKKTPLDIAERISYETGYTR